MLSQKKFSPSSTAYFSASILENICELEEKKEIKEIHHRVRELKIKLNKLVKSKIRFAKTKKYFEKSINNLLEVREHSKELEELANKTLKVCYKEAKNDVKNVIHLAKASAKSALESIKVNKEALAKFR